MISLLVYAIFTGLLLGAGTLAASGLPGRGARIGLGAGLFLALAIDVTWIVAPLVGWSRGLADAALGGTFALVVLVALSRAYHYQGRGDLPRWTWPSARDFAALGVLIVVFGAIVALLPVPLDTDAQGFGYLALMLREGEDYTSLAPWHPEISYLYSPAYPGLIAHFSARLPVGIHALQLAFSAATAVVFLWMAYDFGAELGDRRAGRAFLAAAVIGLGLITAFMDSHYTALLALVCALAFLTFALRALRSPRWSNVLFAAICLAAVPLSQPDTTIALLIGYAPWLIALPLARPRPGWRAWAVVAVAIPLIALALVAPWLASIGDLLGSDIDSPFEVALRHWRTLVFMHGGVIVALALIGAAIGLRQRTPAQLLMIVWLVAIVEFSTLGLLERTFPRVVEPLLKYDYPFSLAWHGPIIPYFALGGTALLALAARIGTERVDAWTRRLAYPALALALGTVALGVAFFDPLLDASREVVSFYGAFSSRADVAAMEWLRDHTPPDARVLNHPGPHEGDWAPIISERDTVYFRPQPFFRGAGQAENEQDAFRPLWRAPDAAPQDFAALLADYGVDYVLLPQVFGAPDRLDEMLRWRPPLPEAASYLTSPLSEASYLRLVYDENGARVYQVLPPGATAR